MLRALELARRGCGHTRPNPPVGAVVVKGGKVVGEGWHRRAGGDHAEVAAMKNAARRGVKSQKGATLYVTLEPCSRPGRVGACTDAIIAAGISKVVYAVPDPNPKNRGRARIVLSKAGVKCERSESDVVNCLARELVGPFAKHVATGLPYVTVKIAMSLDGKICDDWGDARWISSEAARRETGRMRERVDAIMVGGETIRKDDPSLLSHGRQNLDLIRVVVSKSGNLPRNAQVFADGVPNKTFVFDDARKALVELGKMGVLHVLCEGGLKLARSLAEDGLVDSWYSVVSPCVIGSRSIRDKIVFHSAAATRDAHFTGGDLMMNSYKAKEFRKGGTCSLD